MDFSIGSGTFLSEPNNPSAPLVGGIGPNDISRSFEAPEQLIDSLLAHACAFGESSRPDAIRARILKYRHMRETQFLKTGRIQFVDDAAVDGLRGNAQQGANEHVPSLYRPRHFQLDTICKLRLQFSMVNGLYYRRRNSMTRSISDVRTNPSDEPIPLGPLMVRFLITGENSAGSIAAFELMVPGGQRLTAPAHSHNHYEETIYGITGVLTWTVEGMQVEVGPGQALCVPRGAIHRFDNNGTEDVKALVPDHAGGHRSAILPRGCPGN